MESDRGRRVGPLGGGEGVATIIEMGKTWKGFNRIEFNLRILSFFSDKLLPQRLCQNLPGVTAEPIGQTVIFVGRDRYFCGHFPVDRSICLYRVCVK